MGYFVIVSYSFCFLVNPTIDLISSISLCFSYILGNQSVVFLFAYKYRVLSAKINTLLDFFMDFISLFSWLWKLLYKFSICSILLKDEQSYIVEELKNYSMVLLKIFMPLLLVLRFARSLDDNLSATTFQPRTIFIVSLRTTSLF